MGHRPVAPQTVRVPINSQISMTASRIEIRRLRRNRTHSHIRRLNGVRDFVISNRLVSMIMAQISEQREMSEIYETLFSEEGSELYLKPPGLYFAPPLPKRLTFADLMRAGQLRGESPWAYECGPASMTLRPTSVCN